MKSGTDGFFVNMHYTSTKKAQSIKIFIKYMYVLHQTLSITFCFFFFFFLYILPHNYIYIVQ